MEYIKFEKQYGNPSFITMIYWKALKKLEASESDKFIAEFSLFKTEF